MSRTDKDLPYRIREYREGAIDHDHTTGRCVEETREHALEHRISAWRRYDHDCPRRERIETPCAGYCAADNTRSYCWSARHIYDSRRRLIELTPNAWTAEYLERLRLRRIFCDRPHVHHMYHRSIPCDVCDARPTCEYNLDWSYARIAGSAPREYRRDFHRTHRRNERDVLNDARRDYNANGETELEPVDKYQRHCANWYWL